MMRKLTFAPMLLWGLAAACSSPSGSLSPCESDDSCESGAICVDGICREGSDLLDTGASGDVGGDDDVTPDDTSDSDTSETDTSETDTGTDTDTSPTLNACGGEAVLDAEPGESCGECGGGAWACDGVDAVVCEDDGALNACGGCAVLDGQPGFACGACGDGVWTCDGDAAVTCTGASEGNACGGCGPLDGEVGDLCGACGGGTLVCGADGALVCEGGVDTNACGGCGALDGELGGSCGECGGGELVCSGPDALICEDDGELNACGGCGVLEGIPGAACGTCGVWECDGETVSCNEGDTNLCGGCGFLEGTPGETCGVCDMSTTICVSDREVACEDPEAGVNACGGCDVLPAAPGTSCGACGGLWECADGGLFCSGGDTNACGGCDPLIGNLGDPCGTCGGGELVCGDGELVCEGDAVNACGGCGPLDGAVGDACECDYGWGTRPGTLDCATTGDLECNCDTTPECGNGFLEPGEECDDGNNWNNDGCSRTCMIEPDGSCAQPFVLEPGGEMRVNLCGGLNDMQPIPMSDCSDYPSAQDIVLSFTLEEAATVRVFAEDDDFTAPIDVVAYLRADCEDATSQLACADDTDCEDAETSCSSSESIQVRESSFVVDLEAGTYFIVVDSYEYDGVWTCGRVNVTLDAF